MTKNICINCGYFLNCKYASEHITDCDKFVKANRVITRGERKEEKYERDKTNRYSETATLLHRKI